MLYATNVLMERLGPCAKGRFVVKASTIVPIKAATQHITVRHARSWPAVIPYFTITASTITSPLLSKASGNAVKMVFGTRNRRYTIVKYAVRPESISVFMLEPSFVI